MALLQQTVLRNTVKTNMVKLCQAAQFIKVWNWLNSSTFRISTNPSKLTASIFSLVLSCLFVKNVASTDKRLAVISDSLLVAPSTVASPNVLGPYPDNTKQKTDYQVFADSKKFLIYKSLVLGTGIEPVLLTWKASVLTDRRTQQNGGLQLEISVAIKLLSQIMCVALITPIY